MKGNFMCDLWDSLPSWACRCIVILLNIFTLEVSPKFSVCCSFWRITVDVDSHVSKLKPVFTVGYCYVNNFAAYVRLFCSFTVLFKCIYLCSYRRIPQLYFVFLFFVNSWFEDVGSFSLINCCLETYGFLFPEDRVAVCWYWQINIFTLEIIPLWFVPYWAS